MQVRKILIVNVNWLGDVLFSTPFIRAVRRSYPDAFIACIIVPRCREVLEGNPNLDEIIIYNNEDGIHKSLGAKLKFIKSLKRYNFDTVFLLHRSFTRVLMMFLVGIPERIGYYTKKRSFLLTKKPKPPRGQIHRAEYFLSLARNVGLKTDDSGCDFYITAEDKQWADGILRQYGISQDHRLIIFNPGGNWKPKRWPAVRFAELAELLYDHFKDKIKIGITGSKNDLELSKKIQDLARQRPISFCGKTTLRQLAALFQRTELVISADSGPLHIAISMGAKTIGLFGPTSVKITGPYKPKAESIVLHKDVGCDIPCYDARCTEFKCMSAITPEGVFEAAKKIIG